MDGSDGGCYAYRLDSLGWRSSEWFHRIAEYVALVDNFPRYLVAEALEKHGKSIPIPRLENSRSYVPVPRQPNGMYVH